MVTTESRNLELPIVRCVVLYPALAIVVVEIMTIEFICLASGISLGNLQMLLNFTDRSGIALPTTAWNIDFLQSHALPSHRALIIVNQCFSPTLFHRLWNACTWRCCADGGANRLYDIFDDPEFVKRRLSRGE